MLNPRLNNSLMTITVCVIDYETICTITVLHITNSLYRGVTPFVCDSWALVEISYGTTDRQTDRQTDGKTDKRHWRAYTPRQSSVWVIMLRKWSVWPSVRAF